MKQVNVGYQDGEGQDICACCGSYYVVSPKEAEAYQDMYEALKSLLDTSICDICYEDNCGDEFSCTKGKDGEPCECHQRIREAEFLGHKALAKAEGKA